MKRPSFLLLVVPACFVACSSSGTTGASSSSDAGDPDAGAEAAVGPGTQCTAARDQALLPINKVSTGAVSVVSDDGTTKVIYVDASAGGSAAASKSPRVYVNLETGSRVDLTDTQAFSSTAWDLALKRAVLYTNSGDTGIGVGGGAEFSKSFSSVSAADADAADIAPERFFDDQCTLKVDPVGAPLTTFSNWYEYDQATNLPTPKVITYVVKGGTAKRYKVAFTSYNALPDGGTGQSTGMFLLKVAPL